MDDSHPFDARAYEEVGVSILGYGLAACDFAYPENAR